MRCVSLSKCSANPGGSAAGFAALSGVGAGVAAEAAGTGCVAGAGVRGADSGAGVGTIGRVGDVSVTATVALLGEEDAASEQFALNARLESAASACGYTGKPHANSAAAGKDCRSDPASLARTALPALRLSGHFNKYDSFDNDLS